MLVELCYDTRMLVVNPHHWLDLHGRVPVQPRRRRDLLRVARLIEYGARLEPDEYRETLVECTRRPARKPCLGFLWVAKTDNREILAYCSACETDQFLIYSWQDTPWADGPMDPAKVVMGKLPPAPPVPRLTAIA